MNRARSAAPEEPSAGRLSTMNRRMSPAAMTSAFPSTRFARLPLCRAPKSNPANPRNPVVPQSQRRIRVRTKAGVGFRSSTGFFEGPRQLLKPRGASLHAMISSVQNPRCAPHDDPRLFAPWPEPPPETRPVQEHRHRSRLFPRGSGADEKAEPLSDVAVVHGDVLTDTVLADSGFAG